MIARFYKCDFWIPGKISDRHSTKIVSKIVWKYFFEIEKISKKSKNIFGDFFGHFRHFINFDQNFRNFEKSKSIFRNFGILEFWVFKKFQKVFSFFFGKYVFREKKVLKKYFRKYVYLYQLIIFPGFQKSHLENRAMSVNMWKRQL